MDVFGRHSRTVVVGSIDSGPAVMWQGVRSESCEGVVEGSESEKPETKTIDYRR